MGTSFINIPGYTWQSPVETVDLLPLVGNQLGDARVVIDISIVFIWNGSAWVDSTASGSLSAVTGGTDITVVTTDQVAEVSYSGQWKDPVNTMADLPALDNTVGDARVTKDTGNIWVWDGSTWISSIGGSVNWGTIGGTLSDQTDLQNALNAKANLSGAIFSGSISAINLSGINTGDVTLGTPNGLSLTGQILSLTLASASTTGALSNSDWSSFSNKQVSGNYITALTGDGTASGPGVSSFTLSAVNSTTGNFGAFDTVGSFTVNGKGLITSASNALIQISESQVTNLTSDLAGKQPNLTFVDSIQNVSTSISLKGDNASPGANQYYGTDNSSSLGYHNLTTSLTFADSIVNTGGTVTLVNDVPSVSVSNYYGTNSSGILGYFPLPGAGNAITALTSDVSATGPGSVSATVNSVGGSTAASIHTSQLATAAATSSNTASTLVLRDGSGNFIAGTITANLVGASGGGAVTVTGGTATTNGGNATLAGSNGNASNGNGGNANVTAGNAGGAGGSNESGGSSTIQAGSSVGSATGGTVTINSGNGGTGTGTAGATGGTTNVNGGTGGAGSVTSGNGGGATLKGGSGGGGVGGGNGGTAQITGGTGGTGSSTGGTGGQAVVQGGGAGSVAGAAGGTVTLSGGNGSGTGSGGAGGAISISTGVAGGDNTANNTGGSFTVSVGHSAGSSGGAGVQMTAGTGGPGTSTLGANGGTITLTSGAGGVGSATGGNGGNLVLQAGLGGNSGTPGTGGFIQFQTGATTSLTEHMRITAAGNTTFTSGNVEIVTAGFGLQIAHGSNCRLGTATLSAGTVTVSNNTVTANSVIFLTVQSLGTVSIPSAIAVTAKTANTSFVITSAVASDTSVVAWMIVEQI